MKNYSESFNRHRQWHDSEKESKEYKKWRTEWIIRERDNIISYWSSRKKKVDACINIE